MTWFFLAIIGFFFVQIVRSAWRARKPEGVQLDDGHPSAKYILPLLSLGLAAMALWVYSDDTTAYWRVAEAVMWLALGLIVATKPSYSKLNEAQKDSVRRRLSTQWWVSPAMLAFLFVTLWPVALLAPRWLLEIYLTAFFCLMVLRGVWWWRISYEPDG
jgi:hypothetical protein